MRPLPVTLEKTFSDFRRSPGSLESKEACTSWKERYISQTPSVEKAGVSPIKKVGFNSLDRPIVPSEG